MISLFIPGCYNMHNSVSCRRYNIKDENTGFTTKSIKRFKHNQNKHKRMKGCLGQHLEK